MLSYVLKYVITAPAGAIVPHALGQDVLWVYVYSTPTKIVSPHVYNVHLYCGLTIKYYIYYCLKHILAHSSCGPTIRVGLQYMRAYCMSGPTIHVGPQYTWAYNTSEPPVLVGQLYLLAHNTRGPTVHVGLLNMWAHNRCGVF